MRLVRRGLPLGWLVFGTLLPDLIDKPLYYGLVLATGRRGAELGLISGSRTFGHTALLLLFLIGMALWRRSSAWAAIAWGDASHLVLDLLGDAYGLFFPAREGPSILSAIFFPALGLEFPVSPFHSVREHLIAERNAYVILGEALGLVLLVHALWVRRRRRLAQK